MIVISFYLILSEQNVILNYFFLKMSTDNADNSINTIYHGVGPNIM